MEYTFSSPLMIMAVNVGILELLSVWLGYFAG